MYVVFDIGGSKMRMALSGDGQRFFDPVVVPTPQNFDEGMNSFRTIFEELKTKGEIEVVAGGIAGVFSRSRSKLMQAPHLPGWSGNPVYERISEIVGVPLYLENDTAMVGLGEATVGAGRGYNIVAYITISTGVGGTRIVGGSIDVSTVNFEPGHQIIDLDGTVCPDCVASEDGKSLGHWESMISGTAVQKRYGKHPSEITDDKIWEEHAKLVAVGLANTIVHWVPDIVVLGGGMMRSPGIKVEHVKTHLRDYLHIYPIHPEVKKSELEDFGGLHGSLSYIRNLEKRVA